MEKNAKTKTPFHTFFTKTNPVGCTLTVLLLVAAAFPSQAKAQFRIGYLKRPYRLATSYGVGWGYTWNPYAGIPYSFSDYGGFSPYRAHYYYDPAMRLKQDWWGREGAAFKKLEFERATDERLARAHLERLMEIQRGLTRFVNGGTRPMDGAGFRAAITELEASHAQTRFMQQPIQPIAPERLGEFQARGIVTGNGELRLPPHALYGRTESEPSHPAWIQLNAAWRDARWNLIQHKMADADAVALIQQSLQEMQTKAEPRLVSANRSQRRLASQYLRAADRLVRDLQDQASSHDLTKHLNSGRRGFEGGTVGDFVRFVADHKVQVAYGTAAHQVLSDFVSDLQRNLDQQIAATSSNIEQLKAQNPAHNAALKEQAIAMNQTGREYRGDGFRPSTFNFDPQTQTSGLQSQAYGAPRVARGGEFESQYTLPASLAVPRQGQLENRFAIR